jgi:hypothetical protein
MVDVANNHDETLYIKHRFIFIFYTRIKTAIPPFFEEVCASACLSGKVLIPLLIHSGNYAGVMHNLDQRFSDSSNLLIMLSN